MSKNKEGNNGKPFEIPRPVFPKRAVITGGMPYGNKELHFGHVGGTDCYGSPIAEGWRVKVEKGEFEGSLEDFVQRNHDKQQATLDAYG
ncbi:MAG: methionine--tRNA ligase, partial [Ruminococcus sp.]|nr:methionine--tRNA ligase [Ruminococcus sp.]